MLKKEESQKDNQEELEELVLKGYCPNCLLKGLKYQEILEKAEFGFNCYSCGWKAIYRFQEFRDLHKKEKYKKSFS